MLHSLSAQVSYYNQLIQSNPEWLFCPATQKGTSRQRCIRILSQCSGSLSCSSLLCDDAVPVGSLEETIQQAAGKLLEQVTLFDVYKGDQIADGKKSVSFSLRLRSHEGTLTDEQADAAMKRVLKALAAKDVTLRD